MYEFDAVIIGSGPNGLTAAITLAQAGKRVLVTESAATVGGGMRTRDLTLPGFKHDVCSAIHPLGVGSPVLRSMPLQRYGLEWIHPDIPAAHPLDDGSAATLQRSILATAASLPGDKNAYANLLAPLVRDIDRTLPTLLGPITLPRHPFALARFGLRAVRSAEGLANRNFRQSTARALFAGLAAHSFLRLEQPPSAAFGLVLAIVGHRFGWPFPRGGSQAIADAMAGYLEDLGGSVQTNTPISSFAELPEARAYLFSTTPRQLVDIAGTRFPAWYRRALSRYRYGPGVFKVDYALRQPIPWRAEACKRAGTVHLGGLFEDIASAERDVSVGLHPGSPFVLVAQQSLFDDTRAPNGQHTAWAYCHVPSNSTVDMTAAIECQIERFAPGFANLIIGRHTMTTQQFQAYNANFVGGDINGGIQDLRQLFTRPLPKLNPYSTPARDIYLCSASTPPGGGVHGMAGYHAASRALQAADWT